MHSLPALRCAQDIFEHVHDGPFFTGSVVKINAQRASSAVFNLFQAQRDGVNVTTIRGDGLLQHAGDAQVLGALTVQHNRIDASAVTGADAEGSAAASTTNVSACMLLLQRKMLFASCFRFNIHQ